VRVSLDYTVGWWRGRVVSALAVMCSRAWHAQWLRFGLTKELLLIIPMYMMNRKWLSPLARRWRSVSQSWHWISASPGLARR